MKNMKFIVFIKQVPGTLRVNINDDGTMIRDSTQCVLDPFSEQAVRMASNIKKEGDTVIAVTMGPPHAEEALIKCLEFGADEAFLLTDEAFAGADVYATAKTLYSFIKRFVSDYDLILCGLQTTDGNTAQIPAEVAAMLDVGQFYYVENITLDEKWIAYQNYSDERRECIIKKGDVLSISRIFENASPAPNITTSRDEVIKKLKRVDLGLGTFSVGLKGSKTKIISSYPLNTGRGSTSIDGTDPVKAAEIIKDMLL